MQSAIGRRSLEAAATTHPKTSTIPERVAMSFDITQQAIHSGTAMIAAGRIRVRIILSGPTAEDEKAESLLG